MIVALPVLYLALACATVVPPPGSPVAAPAVAINRSNYGGNEMVEAFG